MSKIKICGLKRAEDIQYINETKPDYAGFVFAGVKRKIDFKTAAHFRAILDKNIQSVGVFVNEKIDNIIGLCNDKIIDLVQLHGDEDAAYIYRLKEKVDNKIIKAIKVQSEKLEVESGNIADYVLFDSKEGGSGKAFDWNIIKDYKKDYFLAGGLNKDNVLDAIKLLNPYCVDINSGVETNGVKDYDKIKEVVTAIRKYKLQITTNGNPLRER